MGHTLAMSKRSQATVTASIGAALGLTGILLIANGVLGIIGSVFLSFTLAGPLVWPETNVPSFEIVILPWIRLVGGFLVGGAGLALLLHGLGSFSRSVP
jgi:hypothetical protein